jgi:putative SOS response-associated peptidase YedK
MCGRFTLHTPESRLRKVFNLDQSEPLSLKSRYNIPPSQQVPIIRDTVGRREMVMTIWGLVPHCFKESKTKYFTINTRIELVAEKPAYRTPLKHRRCLIPSNGFYEWKIVDGRKLAHNIRMRDDGAFALAGLWDHWEGEGGSLESCSSSIMSANEVMKPLHERMPDISPRRIMTCGWTRE